MRLDFDSIAIAGFKSFLGEAQTLNLRALPSGVHLMRGRNEVQPRLGANGAGKSTVFDAMTWCLYGRTVGGLRNTDIKPWFKHAKTSVTLKLRVDEEVHTLTRTADPNRILIDGKDASQEQVVELVGLGLDLFANTILLGQGEPLFFDLEPRDKMRLFSDALGLERWEARSERADARAKALQKELNALTTERAALIAVLDKQDDQLKQTRARQDDWQRDLQTRIELYRDDLADADAKWRKAKEKLGSVEVTEDGSEAELDALDKDIARIGTVITELVRKQDHTGHAYDILKRDHDRLQDELGQAGDGTCPTCGQSLSGTKLGEHQREVSKKIAKLAKEMRDMVADKTLTKDIEREEKTRSTLQATREGLVKRRNQAASERLTLARQVDDWKIASEIKRRLLKETEETKSPFREQIETLRRELADGEKKQGDLTADIALLERRLVRAQFWVKGFKDIRLTIIEETLHELELAVNAMLGESGLVDWSLHFDIERETKSGTVQRGIIAMIKAPGSRDAVRWESWSGGEQQRLRVVSALALSDVLLSRAGILASMEVLDEPTRFMTPGGVRDTCEYLALRARSQDKLILYVDHSAVEGESFASTVTVVNDKHGSRLELQ